MPKPRQPAPPLDVELVGGGRWVLAEQRPQLWSVIVFYRGVHCNVCRGYIGELDRLVDDFAAAGATSVVAVSGNDEADAKRTVQEWGLNRVQIGFGHSLDSMRAWGLYLSKGIRDNQPDEYNEPGLFIIKPDGTLYASVVGTMPFMRPPLPDVLETLRWVNEHDYPARGEL
ncbi:MAG TPA: redoxin domain-containing protein [Actinocrinis sp.]|uniref:redoxin domain-containing protein n=1 Tax=Actinocrinis sp. TaxID=1920516 RepID=UPI002DDCC245|nr:redoxin domain-containing protein [Actinocrinis sp.]HEV2347490.1 redoxin domain-containing protein [Actinocrinis sp.]